MAEHTGNVGNISFHTLRRINMNDKVYLVRIYEKSVGVDQVVSAFKTHDAANLEALRLGEDSAYSFYVDTFVLEG